jgi:hypothetical protein
MALIHTATNLRAHMRAQSEDIPTMRRVQYVAQLKALRQEDEQVCKTTRKSRQRDAKRAILRSLMNECIKRIAQWDALHTRLTIATEYPARPDLQRAIKEDKRVLTRAPHVTAVVR